MKIYTRQGDSGTTSLYNGKRVDKDNVRVQVCGEVDELSAAIGIARAEGLRPPVDQILLRIQRELIQFCTEISDPSGRTRIEVGLIKTMESDIDEQESSLPPFREFVISGDNKPSAFLHLARTICRRAERHLVTLIRHEPIISPNLPAYLNRLSDLLFVLARY